MLKQLMILSTLSMALAAENWGSSLRGYEEDYSAEEQVATPNMWLQAPMCDWRYPPTDGNWSNHGCKLPNDDQEWKDEDSGEHGCGYIREHPLTRCAARGHGYRGSYQYACDACAKTCFEFNERQYKKRHYPDYEEPEEEEEEESDYEEPEEEEMPMCDWRYAPADGNWSNHGCKLPDDDQEWRDQDNAEHGCDYIAEHPFNRCSARGKDYRDNLRYACGSCANACFKFNKRQYEKHASAEYEKEKEEEEESDYEKEEESDSEEEESSPDWNSKNYGN